MNIMNLTDFITYNILFNTFSFSIPEFLELELQFLLTFNLAGCFIHFDELFELFLIVGGGCREDLDFMDVILCPLLSIDGVEVRLVSVFEAGYSGESS